MYLTFIVKGDGKVYCNTLCPKNVQGLTSCNWAKT